MDVDNPDNLIVITFTLINHISVPDHEWKKLWESPDFSRFLANCVKDNERVLYLDKFLRAHEELRSLLLGSSQTRLQLQLPKIVKHLNQLRDIGKTV